MLNTISGFIEVDVEHYSYGQISGGKVFISTSEIKMFAPVKSGTVLFVKIERHGNLYRQEYLEIVVKNSLSDIKKAIDKAAPVKKTRWFFSWKTVLNVLGMKELSVNVD